MKGGGPFATEADLARPAMVLPVHPTCLLAFPQITACVLGWYECID